MRIMRFEWENMGKRSTFDMAEVNQRPSLRVWLVQAFMEEPAHVAPFPPWEFEAHIVLVTSQERKPLEH